VRTEIEQHLARSEELISVAEDLFAGGHAADAVSRAYYAMFHAATAVLLRLNIERASHGALIAAFGEHVSKPGLMDRKFHRYLLDGFAARSQSDYEPAPETSADEARETIDRAKEFLSAVKNYLLTDARGDTNG